MDDETARHYLEVGLRKLDEQRPGWQRRQDYLEGRHDLPYAPEGVNAEYESLRRQAIGNWMGIAMGAPVQRMKVDGFRTGTGKIDLDTWRQVWQPNKLDARQSIVFLQMITHGRGIWSVSKNPGNPGRPIVRVENCRRVWIEPNPEDPFERLFAVKAFEVEDRQSTFQLWTPSSVAVGKLQVAYVYDATSWVRFEKRGSANPGAWQFVDSGNHGLGEVPFVPSDANVDSDGVPHGAIDALIPQQDAINTIRFNTLLAMQFSAFRQRVFTGYDPVRRDQQGNPLWKKDADGNVVVDENGLRVPLLNTPGRIGVDRALVFPGKDTKVFDLPESNLDNYIKVYGDFLTSLFATGQVPPQYLLTRMANLSGDALAGAESTLQSLVADLKRGAEEAIETVNRLANRARGITETEDDFSTEVIWADAEARSFAQIIDAIVKLISAGFPKRSAFEMIPGATPPKVEEWMKQIEEESVDPVFDRLTRELASTPELPANEANRVTGAANGPAPVVG